MLQRLDHIVIAVNDLAAATRRTVNLLGRSPSWSGVHPAMGTENTIFRLDNTYLELLAPEGQGPVADELRRQLEAKGEGLFALALGTDDAEAAFALLQDRGLSPSPPIKGLAKDEPSGAFRQFKNVYLPPSETGGVRLFVIEHLSLPDELPPALPLSDASSVVSSVDHVVVMTRDADRAKALYGEKLGIRLALDRTFEARGVRLLFFRLGGLTIEIGAQLSPDGDLEPPPASDDHLWGLAFRVADAEGAHERLAASEYAVSRLRDGHKADTRVFSVKDNPNGVATLVIQHLDRKEERER